MRPTKVFDIGQTNNEVSVHRDRHRLERLNTHIYI